MTVTSGGLLLEGGLIAREKFQLIIHINLIKFHFWSWHVSAS